MSEKGVLIATVVGILAALAFFIGLWVTMVEVSDNNNRVRIARIQGCATVEDQGLRVVCLMRKD